MTVLGAVVLGYASLRDSQRACDRATRISAVVIGCNNFSTVDAVRPSSLPDCPVRRQCASGKLSTREHRIFLLFS